MNKKDIQQLQALLAQPQKIVLIPHKNADGDAIGSALALYHFFINQNHQVQVISPNNYPGFLKWMPGSKEVLFFDYQESYSKRLIQEADLIFLLDFNELSRVGADMQQTLENYQGTYIMIDHHQQPSDVARFLYADTKACATAELVYKFLDKMDALNSIDPDIAACLYTGILTDSGSFRFPATTPETHRIVAHLMEKGANHAKIYAHIFDNNTYDRMQLLGNVLENMQFLPEYKTAYMYVTEADKEKYNFQKGDTEGFVNYALALQGVVFAIIFIEDNEQGIIKISFRSKGNFSVNQFARKHFDGGGHDNAAGGRSSLNLQETITRFLDILPTYKQDLHVSEEY